MWYNTFITSERRLHVTLRGRRNMRSLLVAVVNAETVNRAWLIPDIQWRSRTTPIDAQDAQGRLSTVQAVRYATRLRCTVDAVLARARKYTTGPNDADRPRS